MKAITMCEEIQVLGYVKLRNKDKGEMEKMKGNKT